MGNHIKYQSAGWRTNIKDIFQKSKRLNLTVRVSRRELLNLSSNLPAQAGKQGLPRRPAYGGTPRNDGKLREGQFNNEATSEEPSRSPRSCKIGFTLVELLIVISLFSILAAVGTEIFIPMVRSYNKANIQNEVNQNGNYILSLMADQIRNAKRIVSYSSDSRSSSIQVEDYDGNLITFNRIGDNTGCTISDPKNGYLQMSRLGTNPLTNVTLNNTGGVGKKSGVNIENFVIDVDNGVTPNTVSISLTLSQGCAASTTIDYLARSVFSTTVTLRNY